MKDHEHATNTTNKKPDTKPVHDEVAKKAYAIYLEEGRPQGRDVQNWLEAEGKAHRDFELRSWQGPMSIISLSRDETRQEATHGRLQPQSREE